MKAKWVLIIAITVLDAVLAKVSNGSYIEHYALGYLAGALSMAVLALAHQYEKMERRK